MRNQGWKMGSALLGILLFFTVIAGASGETRVAVADFQNNAEGVTDGARRAITDMLTTELGKMAGISVIERSRLEALAKEHRLAASGLVEGSTAVQIGRLAGVQMIITGSITEFGSSTSGGVIPIGGFNIAVGSNEARVALDVRTIDAETGRVLRTFREIGEAAKDIGGFVSRYGGFAEVEGGDILAAATYNCVQKVVGQIRKDLQMMGISPTFHVVEVRGKKKIFVDAGAMNANAAPGQIFAVFAEGAAITGMGGEILGVEKYHLALLRCVDVKAQYSICELLDGSSAELRKGDLLEPYFDDPKDFKPKSRALAELQSGSPSYSDSILENPQTLPGPALSQSLPVVSEYPQPVQPLQPQPGQPVLPPQPAPQLAPPAASLPQAAHTSESMEVVDYYPLDNARKTQIKALHKSGYMHYADKRFSQAYKDFVEAVGVYAGNYLDAYWAARAAHRAGQEENMIYWLQKALDANPRYLPALEYAKAHASGKVEPGKSSASNVVSPAQPLPTAAPLPFLPPAQETFPPTVQEQPLLLPAPASEVLQEDSPSPEEFPKGKDIRNTSDKVDVVDTYSVSEKVKQDIRNSHNMGLRLYESGDYARAAVAFKYAQGEYSSGDYLDAYWAARTYHKMKKRNESRFWLERALSINPDYEPAKKFQRMYF